jgi:FKBP-type peptidyl-prolyl cis-trans isomerase FkpA
MKKLLLAFAVTGLLSGCLKSKEETVTCNYDECSTKASAAEIQNIKDYLSSKNITATEHCSGLFYAVDSMGTGAVADQCSGVSVRYKGMLTNGNVFDSSNAPTAPFAMMDLVKGWKIGIPKIKVGGGIRLYIPPSLGYGSQEVRNCNTCPVLIPANSILVFEVKLDGVYR